MEKLSDFLITGLAIAPPALTAGGCLEAAMGAFLFLMIVGPLLAGLAKDAPFRRADGNDGVTTKRRP